MVPVFTDGLRENLEMVDGEKPTESGGPSTEETDEPVMASPKLIPAPDSPPRFSNPPEVAPDDTGHTSESFERKCVPSEAPGRDIANYDRPSYDHLHEL